MNENTLNDNPVPDQSVAGHDIPYGKKADAGFARWLSNWAILLSNVLLFASAVNCLFRWLAYGFAYDAVALAVSLIAALVVYFLAGGPKYIASLHSRLLLAVAAVACWAFLMPLVMRMAGFSQL